MQIERKGTVYAQVNVMIPVDIKKHAQVLGINLTKASLSGILAAIVSTEEQRKTNNNNI